MYAQTDLEQLAWIIALIAGFIVITYIRDAIHQRRYRNDPFYRRQVQEESRTVILR